MISCYSVQCVNLQYARDDSPNLQLPRELRVETLSHVLRQGDTISVSEEKSFTASQRTCRSEAERLKNLDWKRPKRHHTPGVLLACREFYTCGVSTFWGGNTFVFGDFDALAEYLRTAHVEVPASIRSLSVGEDCHMHTYTHVTSPSRWPPPNWPQTSQLDILARLPKLKHLELATGSIAYDPNVWTTAMCRSFKDLKKVLPPWLRWADCDNMAPLYVRDHILTLIPDTVFDRLKSLEIRYFCPNPKEHWEMWLPWTSVDVLGYATDLRQGGWRESPHWTPHSRHHVFVNEEEQARSERWLEARAAVYWEYDRAVPEAVNPALYHLMGAADAGGSLQWCTWACEWVQCCRKRGGWRQQPLPYDALLGEGDGGSATVVQGGA